MLEKALAGRKEGNGKISGDLARRFGKGEGRCSREPGGQDLRNEASEVNGEKHIHRRGRFRKVWERSCLYVEGEQRCVKLSKIKEYFCNVVTGFKMLWTELEAGESGGMFL